METPIIETRNLKKYFKTPRGLLHAVDDVTLKVNKGETLGVVGESGCGKSTLGRCIARLLDVTEGQILYNERDIAAIRVARLGSIRKDIQMVFQDPFTSLNPRLSIGQIIAEPIKVTKMLSGRKQVERKVVEIMERCGLPERYFNVYPHELDGGRRQRVGLARAMVLEPQFIVCDEPVSALDVSVQAQILNLLMDLQEIHQLTYMFITHDLCVVKHISNYIAVMYLGQVVEYAAKDELFEHRLHPYTEALLSAIPVPNLTRRGIEYEVLQGEVSNPINPKPGCRFAPRCKYATAACQEPQEFKEVSKNHFVRCHRVTEG